MRALLLILVGWLCGCVEPASRIDASCEPRCLSERSAKLGAYDVLFTSPGLSRFYDDYAETLSPACGADDAGQPFNEWVPLWRHTINPLVPSFSRYRNPRFGTRGAIATHPNGKVAVMAGGMLWLFDGPTGTPEHALFAVDAPELAWNQGRVDFSLDGVVAFTPDGGLWVNGNEHPALLDLQRWDRHTGPRVAFAWEVDHPSDPWNDRSQAVGDDGTLFWRGTSGVARALQPDGRVRWQAQGLGGTPRVDSNDFVFWSYSSPPRALAASDGREVWRPQEFPQWTTSELTNSENAPLRALVPVTHHTNTTGALSLHRLDGTVASVFELGLDGGLGFIPDSTAQSDDGVLFSAVHTMTDSTGADVGAIEAFDQLTQVKKWARALVPLATDPLAGKKDVLYVATKDCRVSVLDSNGNVSRTHRMLGLPTGDLMQLQNGILYVLTQVGVPLGEDERVRPGDFTVEREDGGVSKLEDYECLDSSPLYCGPAVEGRNHLVFVLYAFAVE